jgi:hypothetical protein
MRLKGTDHNPIEIQKLPSSEPSALRPDIVDLNFLITATELRDRKTKRRRKHSRSKAIRRPIDVG